MSKYRVWLLALVVGMCVCSWAGNAGAWELKMNGNFDWEYRFVTQTGNQGFFGRYDLAAADVSSGLLAGTFAPYNFWAGWNRRAGIVSGSDASWATQYMDTFIDIKINPALQIRGWYRIGEWAPAAYTQAATQPVAAGDLGAGDLVASEYLTYRYGGVQRSFSPGYWNYLFMTAQLPWGIVNFGKRRSVFGMGLAWNGEDTRSSESVSLSALYGPLNMTFGFYPSRRGATAASNVAGAVGTATGLAGYFNRDRNKNDGRMYDMSLTTAYRAGAVDTGFTINFGPSFHTGGEGVIDSPLLRGAAGGTGIAGANPQYVYLDNHVESYGGAYFKFNNGRFFFNGEVDFFQQTERTRGHLPSNVIGRGISPFVGPRDLSIDHWRAAAEIGTFCGPAKVSGLFAWLSGGDRRGAVNGTAGGFLIGQIDNNGILRSNSFANTGMFRPYSYLINEVYGTGVFVNADTTKGYIEDAIIYAARVDYAVAANLNVSTSFMWADRNSKSGFGWGVIRPDTSATVANNIGQINNTALFNVWNNLSTPNIPDSNIGYEIGAGLDWKLLEGLVVKGTVAYWQPGKWFVWACRDKNILGWGQNLPIAWLPGSTPATAFINPERSIDPVYGLELKVEGQF